MRLARLAQLVIADTDARVSPDSLERAICPFLDERASSLVPSAAIPAGTVIAVGIDVRQRVVYAPGASFFG